MGVQDFLNLGCNLIQMLSFKVLLSHLLPKLKLKPISHGTVITNVA